MAIYNYHRRYHLFGGHFKTTLSFDTIKVIPNFSGRSLACTSSHISGFRVVINYRGL